MDRVIRANRKVFEEAMKMTAEGKQVILEIAEELGWLVEIKKKATSEVAREVAREIAKGFKQDNVPLNIIVKNTGLTAQEIEAL